MRCFIDIALCMLRCGGSRVRVQEALQENENVSVGNERSGKEKRHL